MLIHKSPFFNNNFMKDNHTTDKEMNREYNTSFYEVMRMTWHDLKSCTDVSVLTDKIIQSGGKLIVDNQEYLLTMEDDHISVSRDMGSHNTVNDKNDLKCHMICSKLGPLSVFERPTNFPNIKIGYYPDNWDEEAIFPQQVSETLECINRTKCGKDLLGLIGRYEGKGKTVVIRETTASAITYQKLDKSVEKKLGLSLKENYAAASSMSHRRFFLAGAGSGAQIEFNTTQRIVIMDNGRPKSQRYVNDISLEDRAVILFHELLHAIQMIKGNSKCGIGSRYDENSPAAKEEYKVVGIGQKYEKRKLTENQFRTELGLRLRKFYAEEPSETRKLPLN